jgi:hypothetical protein
MRATMLATLAVLAAASAGCLRQTTFACTTDTECGAGTCELVGYCSFADADCPSGRRYSEFSGDYASRCVGDDPAIDADPNAPDAGPADAAIDGGAADAATTCLPTYMTLAGESNRYRYLAATMTWFEQQLLCTNDGAYLVVPDTMAEHQAVTTLAVPF